MNSSGITGGLVYKANGNIQITSISGYFYLDSSGTDDDSFSIKDGRMGAAIYNLATDQFSPTVTSGGYTINIVAANENAGVVCPSPDKESYLSYQSTFCSLRTYALTDENNKAEVTYANMKVAQLGKTNIVLFSFQTDYDY